MALLPELVWCECRMASMSQVRRQDRGDHDASKGETSYHWNYTWTERLFTSPTPQVAPSRPSDRASRRLPAAGCSEQVAGFPRLVGQAQVSATRAALAIALLLGKGCCCSHLRLNDNI